MNVEQLNHEFSDKHPREIIGKAIDLFHDKITLASSLGLEDQLLTHYFLDIDPNASVFVLDTGRLHSETYAVMAETESKYKLKYRLFFPDSTQVQDMVSSQGINLFYESIENRKYCCHIRKVEPLKRALTGMKAWITGMRKDQSITRQDLSMFSFDDVHGIVKINPLIHWSEDDVRAQITQHDVPYNALHDQGYPSIGCAPCTRAINPGDDTRSGRWWWETPDQKECGLHMVDGKLVRKKDS